MLALIIEANLCDESIDRHCLEAIATGLEDIDVPSHHETSADLAAYDQLPTNLL